MRIHWLCKECFPDVFRAAQNAMEQMDVDYMNNLYKPKNNPFRIYERPKQRQIPVRIDDSIKRFVSRNLGIPLERHNTITFEAQDCYINADLLAQLTGEPMVFPDSVCEEEPPFEVSEQDYLDIIDGGES